MEAETADAARPTAPVDLSGRRLWDDLRRSVARAVVGSEEPLRLVALALLADGHVLLEDVPGTGKTLLARAVARSLDLRLARVQGTPDLLPSDVTGASIYEGGSLRFVEGPVFANLLLVDEVNRATPRTQSALLEAMQERQVTVEGVTRPLPDPFLVLATQNPVEFEGTFALPQAQLDRFLLRARVGYPDGEGERRIARRHQDAAEPLDAIDVVIGRDRLLEARDRVRTVHVADEVEAYLVDVVRATRTHPDLALGGSPRATVALYRVAQAAAVLDARAFVTPDDVKAVAPAVLAHRLVVDLDRSLHGASVDDALASILASIALIIAGSALDVPIAIVLGVVTLLLDVVHAAWERRGLGAVRYARHLAARRVPFGEPLALEVEAWNRSALPVAWLRADDEATYGLEVQGRDLEDGSEPGTSVLRNAWTLRPWERVRRRFLLRADRRGVFTIGPVELSAGDPFARRTGIETRPGVDTFLVWPRTIPTTELEPPDRWGDRERAIASLAEDPARFAGVRDYAPGDPLRRVHARSSARVGRPVVKRFEPSRDREVLIALDVQAADGPVWESGVADDDVEALYSIAGSLARTLALRRVAFGILVGGYTGAETRIASVPVSSAPGQAERVLDLLARLSGHASMPFDRLLAVAARSVRPGTTVLVLTARDPRSFIAALRRLERAGAEVVVVAGGPQSARDAARARQAGFQARRAVMDGTWRSADRLVISR